MSAPLPSPAPAAHTVWIVGVSWRASAGVMAPFAPPRRAPGAASGQTAASALIAAALDDAGVTLPVAAAKLLVVGEAAVAADIQISAAAHHGIERYETLAAAVHAAIDSLQGEPALTCLIGAHAGQKSGAWLVLETAASARARGAAAYAVISAVSLARFDPHPTSPASGRGVGLHAEDVDLDEDERAADVIAIGWLELPAGEKDASVAAHIFAPGAAVLAGALCSAALARAEGAAVRDTLALVRAALALGHKVLPLVRPPDSEPESARAAALPWIHPLPLPGHPVARTPRRAGWLTTATDGRPAGFLLQEEPASPARPDVVPFDQELCVFGAESPAALRTALVALQQRLRAAERSDYALDLVDIAAQTAAELPKAQAAAYRLAVVTSSRAELDRQLHELISQLAPATPAALQTLHRPSSGIYCGSGLRSAADGTTAFLFPGLGASYPAMLGDLCLHFPAVREVFDSIDFVAAELGEKHAPSQQVFPRPGAASQETATGAAVITLLMAEWALAQLLRELGITPDALMGCSTGEFAALCQGGSIDEVAALPIIYRLSLGVARGLPAAQLATLQTVLVTAAADSLTPLFSAAPGPLYVSADLGADCALLVGERSAVAWLLAALEARGVVAHVLPSGVPYHTPLLSSATVSGAAELSALTVVAPKLPIWSCATARPYPAAPAAILGDASVLFVRAIALRDTIEAMYQSGVRTFLEVGPGEGLGRRVGAILRGRPHVALASNVQQRTGVAQLMHLLAALHALGHALDLTPLFRRRPQAAALSHPVALPAPQPPPRAPYLSRSQSPAALARSGTALPALTLSLPRSERWCCLRIDHWELLQAAGQSGIDPTAIYGAAELQQAGRLRSGATSLLADWAAKRAVQTLLGRLTRYEAALPAIALTTTQDGETRATGDWLARLGGALTVATADCGDAAVALVAAADLGVRIGIALSQATTLPISDAQTAVCRALFPAQPLRASELQVATVDPWTGWVALRAAGYPSLLHARAVRLGAYFVTIAVLPRA